jgi:hypothetical protein
VAFSDKHLAAAAAKLARQRPAELTDMRLMDALYTSLQFADDVLDGTMPDLGQRRAMCVRMAQVFLAAVNP